MKTSEVLTQAKALLTPNVWGKAPNVGGTTRRLCLLLAIDNVAPTAEWKNSLEMFRDANGLRGKALGVWNDIHTYDEVMVGFDKAILLAQARELNNAETD